MQRDRLGIPLANSTLTWALRARCQSRFLGHGRLPVAAHRGEAGFRPSMNLYMVIYIAGMAVFYALARRHVLVAERSGAPLRGMTGGWLAVELTAGYVASMLLGASVLYWLLKGRGGGLWGGYALFFVALAPYVALRCSVRGAVLDAVAIAVPGGMVVAKLACLQAGCCHGTQTTVSWAITNPDGVYFPADVPIHPTQAYDMLVFLIAAVVAWVLVRRRLLAGKAVLVSLTLMCFGRLVTGFSRGDERVLTGPLSLAQLLSGTAGILSLLVVLVPLLSQHWDRWITSSSPDLGVKEDSQDESPKRRRMFSPVGDAIGLYLFIVFHFISAPVTALMGLVALIKSDPSSPRWQTRASTIQPWLLLAAAVLAGLTFPFVAAPEYTARMMSSMSACSQPELVRMVRSLAWIYGGLATTCTVLAALLVLRMPRPRQSSA